MEESYGVRALLFMIVESLAITHILMTSQINCPWVAKSCFVFLFFLMVLKLFKNYYCYFYYYYLSI